MGCFLILVAARGAVPRQYTLYSATSDFVILDLTVRGLVASLWLYPLHFSMDHLMRSPGSIGATQGELPGGTLSECDTISTHRQAGSPTFVFQHSFFFFARMSCSEQSPLHGQASDRVWSFPNCSFKASRRKKNIEQASGGPHLAGRASFKKEK